MSEQNVEIVRRIYTERLIDRDPKRLVEHFATPDIEYLAPPDDVDSGYRGGRTEVSLALRRARQSFSTYRHELRKLFDFGDTVVAAVRFRATSARRESKGEIIQKEVAHTWTLRDGKVVRLETGRDLKDALEAAGLSESAISQEERIAENEDFCRDLNKSKADWLKSGLPVAGFRCECWRFDCGVRIRLSRREWEEARSKAERFAVAPGHTATNLEPGVEEVVKKYEHFWIVEKRGEAGEEAAKRE